MHCMNINWTPKEGISNKNDEPKHRSYTNIFFEDQLTVVEPTIADKSKMYLSILNNEIAEDEYKSQCIIPIVLEGDAKVYHDN